MNAFKECSLPDFVCDESQIRVKHIDDSQGESLASDYKTLKGQIKFLQTQMDAIRDDLIALAESNIGDKKIVSINGLQIEKIMKKGSVDYSIIPELDFVDIDKYRKCSVEYWKIGEI